MNWGLGGGGDLESERTTNSVTPSGMAWIPASARRMRVLTWASMSGNHGMRLVRIQRMGRPALSRPCQYMDP